MVTQTLLQLHGLQSLKAVPKQDTAQSQGSPGGHWEDTPKFRILPDNPEWLVILSAGF